MQMSEAAGTQALTIGKAKLREFLEMSSSSTTGDGVSGGFGSGGGLGPRGRGSDGVGMLMGSGGGAGRGGTGDERIPLQRLNRGGKRSDADHADDDDDGF